MADTSPAQNGLTNEKAPGNDMPTSNGKPTAPKDVEKDAEKRDEGGQQKPKNDGPAGGFDDTPIPSRPAGYTLKITIHRADNLPMADINSLSSDPYVIAHMESETPTRHKEDPPLLFRTPTIRQSTDPTWNEEWIVANVPATGFKLKLRVYDEDPADKDDRLGNVHVHVDSLSESWPGIKEQSYEIKARSGSKRAYLIRSLAVCFQQSKHMRGDLYLSVENLGRTPEDGQNGRLYTVGPCRWVRHYDPMLGRLVNMKEDSNDEQDDSRLDGATAQRPEGQQEQRGRQKSQRKVQRYNFQANQIQLEGPVPAHLYHRYVEFKPWVKRMFTSHGLQGVVLGKALHHQHSRVYNFDRKTEWGHFPQGPSKELTQQFLDLVHYDKGGRIFTYVLTLDALWRFTETGKEFGIDMLSKHTMHSDVSIYIAFSGEFFIRRLKHPHRPKPPEPVESTSQDHPPEHGKNETHPPHDFGASDEEPPTDPSHYQVVIDNDSGTYRPNAKMLPVLKEFLTRSLPGLHIQTLDCQADEEKMNKMKSEQRERKKKEGDGIVYVQGSRSSSISSSDEEDLDRIQAGLGGSGGPSDGNVFGTGAKDLKRKQAAKVQKAKGEYGFHPRPQADQDNSVDAAPGAQSSGGAP